MPKNAAAVAVLGGIAACEKSQDPGGHADCDVSPFYFCLICLVHGYVY